MSHSRLTVMIGTFVLSICTAHFASEWFPLTGTPVLAQERISKLQVKPPQGEPIRVGGNVQESKLIHKVNPKYPEQAKREGIEGTARFVVIINEEGLVYEIRTDPDNNPILEEAAIEAVMEWKYSPTLLNGKPVPIMATVSIVFHLKETPEPGDALNAPPVLSSGREPIRVGGDVQESKLIRRIEPIYPEMAYKARIQGRTVLVVTVNEEGFVTGGRRIHQAIDNLSPSDALSCVTRHTWLTHQAKCPRRDKRRYL